MCLPTSSRKLEVGVHKGYEWEVTTNGMGVRCGYIRLEPGHKWFEKHYNEIEAFVHGGLTFAEYGTECPTHGAVAEWWIGFDCGHGIDSVDPELMTDEYKPVFLKTMKWMGEIRSTEYVKNEIFQLIDQAEI